ncbi:MAG: type IV pilus secretin PilQ [bacterium]|nr:type IV pilus secretin PilQ [bacterium]
MMKKGRVKLSALGILIGSMLLAGLLGCASVSLDPPQELNHSEAEEIQVRERGARVSNIFTEALVGKIRITVEADSEMSYTAFKLTEPLRLVLDLPNVDTATVSERSYRNSFPLMRITPFQFDDGDKVNSRIEIALSRIVPYQVFSDANKLFIDLETPGREAAISPAAGSALPPGFEELAPLQKSSSIVVETKPGITPPSQTKPVMIQPVAQIETLPVSGAGTVELVEAMPLPGTSGVVIKGMAISEISGNTHVTIHTSSIPEFDIKRSQAPARLTIDLKQSDLPPGSEKLLIPDAVGTTVRQARLFQLRRTPEGTDNVVRVLVDLVRPTKHEVMTEPGKLIVKLQNQSVFTQAEMAVASEDIVEVPLTTGIESALEGDGTLTADDQIAEDPSIRAPKTGDDDEYKGQLISLHFQEAEILDVLQVIAEVSGLNLVVHPNVSGLVTVHLTNIPWDQALDIILKMNSPALSVEIEGNILRVAEASVFTQEIAQKDQLIQDQIDRRRLLEQAEPLETRLITINFAEPGEIVGLIEDYFQGALPESERENRRGTITVDTRTKTLIVQDTADNIKQIEQIVATLDRRTPQVMIEAKIVTLNTLYVKELGIQWLGSFNIDAQHGNALDFRWPHSINSQTPAGAPSGFGVNLPSSTAIGSTGWMRFGSIDDVFTLFAKIDAAEIDNKAKTLSQPKIFTQDNVAANVSAQQTRTIPSFGDNTQATTVVAPLTLSVTPRISNDGYITMVVNVNNTTFVDTSDLSNLATSGQTLNSQVTVKDGSTVVIGGIFLTSEQDNFAGVPFLHKIPVFGHLFKSTMPNATSQQELLVFLTPRILDRNVISQEVEESADVSLSY